MVPSTHLQEYDLDGCPPGIKRGHGKSPIHSDIPQSQHLYFYLSKKSEPTMFENDGNHPFTLKGEYIIICLGY